MRFILALTATLLATISPLQLAGQSVDEWSVPPRVSACMAKLRVLALRWDINPFYISADFDGDGTLDYSVQVTESASGKKGILVCLSAAKSQLLGAGQKFVWDDSLRFDSWHVISKAELRKFIGRRARGDALILIIKESANGIVYWTGKAFRWMQLDD